MIDIYVMFLHTYSSIQDINKKSVTCVKLACGVRYVHADMQDLEETLKEAADARMRLIVTDGEYTSLLLSHAVCTSFAWSI